MKFAEIIREAGFYTDCFPKASNISVTLYDRKDRVITEAIHFAKPLFAENKTSMRNFIAFLQDLEEKDTPQEMNVKIDEYLICVFYKSPNAKVFLRCS